MKTVRIFTFVLLGFIATAGQAQMQLGLTAGPQFPLGEMADYHTGIGVNVCGKYFVTDEAAFGVNLGYSHFGTDYDDISGSFMPITALFEYHLEGDVFKPYLGFDLGGYNYTVKYVLFGDNVSESEFNFGFAPSAGFMYGLSDNMYVTGNLKWNYVMTDNQESDWLGLNLGVVLEL